MRKKPVRTKKGHLARVVTCRCGRVFMQNYPEHVVCDLDCGERKIFLEKLFEPFISINPAIIHHTT